MCDQVGRQHVSIIALSPVSNEALIRAGHCIHAVRNGRARNGLLSDLMASPAGKQEGGWPQLQTAFVLRSCTQCRDGQHEHALTLALVCSQVACSNYACHTDCQQVCKCNRTLPLAMPTSAGTASRS